MQRQRIRELLAPLWAERFLNRGSPTPSITSGLSNSVESGECDDNDDDDLRAKQAPPPL